MAAEPLHTILSSLLPAEAADEALRQTSEALYNSLRVLTLTTPRYGGLNLPELATPRYVDLRRTRRRRSRGRRPRGPPRAARRRRGCRHSPAPGPHRPPPSPEGARTEWSEWWEWTSQDDEHLLGQHEGLIELKSVSAAEGDRLLVRRRLLREI